MNNNTSNMNNNDPNDYTMAFSVNRTQKKPDSIKWIVSSLLILFVTIMATFRLTMIGRFIDEIFFAFPFGWFKYAIYLILFITSILIFCGLKIKFKKRFLFIVAVVFVSICFLISSTIFFINSFIDYGNEFNPMYNKFWDKNIFQNSFDLYTKHWLDKSLFSKTNPPKSFFISESGTFWNAWAGGGVIGTFLTGVFSYLTTPIAWIISILTFVLTIIWIFFGHPLYWWPGKKWGPKFKERKYKRLKILSVKSKINGSSKRGGIVNVLNLRGDIDNEEVASTSNASDITIEFPSYTKNKNNNFDNDMDFDDLGFIASASAPSSIVFNSAKQIDSGFLTERSDYFDNNDSEFYSLKDNTQSLKKTKEINVYENLEKKVISTSISTPSKKVITSDEGYSIDTSISPMQKKSVAKSANHPGQTSLDSFLMEVEEENVEIKEIEDQYKNRNYSSPIIKSNPINHIQQEPKQVASKVEVKPKEQEPMFVNKSYILPPMSILAEDKNSANAMASQVAENEIKAANINLLLQQFKVDARITHINTGPTITKFEITPAPGTRVNSITKLENDLKLTLASQNVRIEAPIQGKAAVGIEVPNTSPLAVPMKGVIANPPLNKANSKLLFAIGKSVTGEVLFGELDKMPHLLVAGSTGSGKSVMINGLIASILMRAKPHEVKFIMIDPKKVELAAYANIPHLLTPVINDMLLASNVLKKVINEMDRRYMLFTQNAVKNIEGFNNKQKDITMKLPFIVVIIDELADLMMTGDRKGVEEAIMRITQMARAAGIHLIVATQRPSVDVLTGVIKSNIPTRISFAVTSQIDSRTILDQVGAEKLVGRGDMLYMPPGSSSLLRAQGAYISDDEIEKIVEHCAKQQRQMFDAEYEQEEISMSQDGSSSSQGGSSNSDPMLKEIIRFIVDQQKASTSLLQRKFSIGYNRAGKIIDQLEEEGIIGPQNGAKPREVFLKKEDL
ncbi:DNA translocase [Spiroplasma sp. TIUS-1]|uniref:DNA translocase FtsK n=1 Tax=Spiroplasma sp. TIUS-1 TaxID=216963 RepID=UPI0013995088|nr:DNA translocase FtsK [Spiroplasma sp. TIUS-1]QHX36045.1 DNA translocase [Spiroplasma sp. TIUS-1]